MSNGRSTRRQVIVQTLTSGFALAVQPVSAATISTAVDGLEAGEVRVPTAAGELPAYRVKPGNAKGRLPLVLVVHEIFGVHEHIKDVCRRLARRGYLALAPELFARQGDVSRLADPKDINAKVVSKVPDVQVMADLDATVAFAGKSEGADSGRIAVTGFCWGGRIAWLYAAHASPSSLKAAVAWYGRLTGDRDDLRPRFPMDVVRDIKVPVLGLYGGKDQGIPVESVESMRALLKSTSGKTGKRSEIKLYPEAGHAFLADYRPSFHKPSAEDGWKRMLAWFKKHGVA